MEQNNKRKKMRTLNKYQTRELHNRETKDTEENYKEEEGNKDMIQRIRKKTLRKGRK